MIVVSNTSPLTNMAAVGQVDLLPRLYQKVIVPTGVWDELLNPEKIWTGKSAIESAGWVEQKAVQNQALVTALQRDLDKGESECIALALELNADFVIMDEREGRRAARGLGLEVIGVLGVLIEAKAKGLIQEVRPHMDSLRQSAGFYLSDAIYRHTLKLAKE